MVGGLTNSNYRVDVDGDAQSYFVKVPGPGTEGFIDRATASAASVQAAEMGVGPTVFYSDPETGIEVSEFLDGYQPCTAWDVGRPEVCAELMGLFRTWHSGPTLPQTKTVFDMVEEHREQVLRDGTVMPPWVLEVLAAYDEAKARFLAAGLDIVPCHNDPGAGNYMRSITDPSKPMKLIDYDYASNNERAYEIGVFVGFNFFDEEQTRHAIESYFGRCEPRTVGPRARDPGGLGRQVGPLGPRQRPCLGGRLRLLQVRPLGPAARPLRDPGARLARPAAPALMDRGLPPHERTPIAVSRDSQLRAGSDRPVVSPNRAEEFA